MDNIDITKLSKDLLKQALTQGYIVLPNSADIRELTTVQILSIAKSVVKDGLSIDSREEDISSNLPSDLLVVDTSSINLTDKNDLDILAFNSYIEKNEILPLDYPKHESRIPQDLDDIPF